MREMRKKVKLMGRMNDMFYFAKVLQWDPGMLASVSPSRFVFTSEENACVTKNLIVCCVIKEYTLQIFEVRCTGTFKSIFEIIT